MVSWLEAAKIRSVPMKFPKNELIVHSDNKQHPPNIPQNVGPNKNYISSKSKPVLSSSLVLWRTSTLVPKPKLELWQFQFQLHTLMKQESIPQIPDLVLPEKNNLIPILILKIWSSSGPVLTNPHGNQPLTANEPWF
jgi:hypothetical protein